MYPALCNARNVLSNMDTIFIFLYISISSDSLSGNVKLGLTIFPSKSMQRNTGNTSFFVVSWNIGFVDHGAFSIWKYGELTPVTQKDRVVVMLNLQFCKSSVLLRMHWNVVCISPLRVRGSMV